MTQPYYPQQPMPQPQFVQPQQTYVQPTMPQYPMQPQGYQQQPQFVQPPPVPLVQGTLTDFFNQPSTGGGPVFSWKGKPIGSTYGGIVARQITNADIQQQSTPGTNQPAYYRDGRPKYLMKVPLSVQQTPEFPDGQAQWWVSGSARDELNRAMAEAGCDPNSVPEVGAAIVITLTGERPSGPGMNPSKTYRVQYNRPPGAPQPTLVAVNNPPVGGPQYVQTQPTQTNGVVSVQLQQPQTMSAVTTQPQQVQPMPQPAPVQPQQTVSMPAQQGQAMQQPAPVQHAPSDLNSAQQELLQTLIAQQQQQ